MILLAFIVLGGTLAAIAFHAWNALYLHHGYPQSTFLFLPDDRFMDFLNGYRYARDLGHGSLSVSYSPLVMFCLWILTSVPSTSAYLFVAATFSLLATLMVWRFIADAEPETVHRMMVTLILVAMSYPMLFILDRGNLDIFVFAALAGFFYLHFVRHSAWSIVFLAAAIAFKYYPATLLVLLLADRLYRRTLLTVALAVAMTAASAWALGFTSGLGYAGVLQAVRDQLFAHGEYSQTLGSVQYSHNVWSVLAWVTDLRGMESFPQQALTPLVHLPSFAQAYLVVALLLFAVISAYVIFVEQEAWRRTTLLVLCFLLLPYESHDYTLVHLYFPLALFVNGRHAGRADRLFVVLFALPLIPLDYWLLPGTDVSIATLIYPLILGTLAGLIVAQGLRGRSPSLPRRSS